MSETVYKIKYWHQGETIYDAEEALHSYKDMKSARKFCAKIIDAFPDINIRIEKEAAPKINICEFEEFNARFEKLYNDLEEWVLGRLNGCTVKHPSLDRPLKVSGAFIDVEGAQHGSSIVVKLYDLDNPDAIYESDTIDLECATDWEDLEIIKNA
jgi:hypothetical protein